MVSLESFRFCLNFKRLEKDIKGLDMRLLSVDIKIDLMEESLGLLQPAAKGEGFDCRDKDC